MHHDELENQKQFYSRTWRKTHIKNSMTPGVPGWLSTVPNKHFTTFLSRYLKRCSLPQAFLDIGCGAGRHAVYAAKQGFDVTGIDFSFEAIAHARRYASEEGVSTNTHFLLADATALPFEDHSFDLINDSGCLNHLLPSQWKAYSKEVLRVLKPNGTFRLKAASRNARDVWGYDPSNPDRRWFKQTNGVYKYYFSEEELLTLFAPLTIESLKDRFVSAKNKFFFLIARAPESP